VIAAQSSATEATLGLFSTAVISRAPEKQHSAERSACVLGGLWPYQQAHGSRAGYRLLLSLSAAFQAQGRRGTPAHFSTLQQSRDTCTFQFCGLKVSGKYQLLYSKAQELFCSTKMQYLFPCHEDKAQGWMSCTSHLRHRKHSQLIHSVD